MVKDDERGGRPQLTRIELTLLLLLIWSKMTVELHQEL